MIYDAIKLKSSLVCLIGGTIFCAAVSCFSAANADGDHVAQPHSSGLYTNRHHHEMNTAEDTGCEPDFYKTRDRAEMAVGQKIPGVYHTRSREVSDSKNILNDNVIPDSAYVEITPNHGRGDRHTPKHAPKIRYGYGVEIDPNDFSRDKKLRDISKGNASRDCLSTTK